MAPSSRERALGARTRLLLREFAAGRESAEFQQREAPRGAAGCHPEGPVEGTCGQKLDGREGGREGGQRSHC